MGNKYFSGLLVFVSCLLVAAVGFWFAGYRVNVTPSYPLGFWKKLHHFDPSSDVGKWVLISPIQSEVFDLAKERQYLHFGFSKTSLQPLLKEVVALPGDFVTVNDNGVWVNDRLIKNSRPLKVDSMGRKLTQQPSQILQDGFVWLMSQYNPKSFDSRYFGPLPMANIQAVMEPVWVWPSF